MTELRSCDNYNCTHNTDYKEKNYHKLKRQCTLGEMNLVTSYGRSTDYAHVLMCRERDEK